MFCERVRSFCPVSRRSGTSDKTGECQVLDTVLPFLNFAVLLRGKCIYECNDFIPTEE